MVPLGQLLGTHDQGGAAYRRPPFFRTKKIAILGSSGGLEHAPWHDPSWTLIAHPCCRPKCKREPDWYFDMHRPECFQNEKKPWNLAYYTWLKRLQTPIFMQRNWPEIPMAVKYPLELVDTAEFRCSVTGRLFASNHPAFMFPLAMMEGITHIGLFGCQYAGGERGTQRDGLVYWIGRYEQWGGTVVVPRSQNTLMEQPLYGYASHDEKGKLIDCYRPPMALAKESGAAVQLMPLSDGPLMAHPHGEAPALDRMRELYAVA
jgi:hypothetical protein